MTFARRLANVTDPFEEFEVYIGPPLKI